MRFCVESIQIGLSRLATAMSEHACTEKRLRSTSLGVLLRLACCLSVASEARRRDGICAPQSYGPYEATGPKKALPLSL